MSFKIGDKVVPVSKNVGDTNIEEVEQYMKSVNGDCLTARRVDLTLDGKPGVVEAGITQFYFFLESDLIPYVEPKPYNNRTVTNEIFLLPEHNIINSKTIFNGPATICILSYDNKQFKGVAKCNPADTYNENIGQLIATERASIELSKYRITQAVR